MKHITYGDKSLLLGDDAADVLIEYAATLTAQNTGDSVKLSAISSDGDEVEATFLLGPGTTMMAETSTNSLEAPDSTPVVDYMRTRIAQFTQPHNVEPQAESPTAEYEEPRAFE